MTDWLKPHPRGQLPAHAARGGSLKGGSIVLRTGGPVQFLPETIHIAVLAGMVSRNGGEVVKHH